MNKQEVFDIVIKKLTQQGCPSIANGICQYRDSAGNKCAIGHLIPDELYDPKFEGEIASLVLESLRLNNYTILDDETFEDSLTFFNDLQLYLHDDIASTLNWEDALNQSAKSFADLYSLEYTSVY